MTNFRIIPAATALALLLSTGAVSAEVVLNRGNDTDPATLDHHKTSTVAEGNVMRDLYDGLVIQDENAEVVAGAAESWEISDDGLTYTFHLREDGKWSNGDPVTAQDFLFTFRRIMTPETAAGYASMLYPINNAEAIAGGEMEPDQLGVEAVDDHTLVITLHTPTPYFLELLTHQTGLPMHQASVEEHGDAFTRPGNLVTNGAFMLESFTPNDRIVMRKNPHYYDADEVQIDVLNYIPFEDRANCMRRFEAGEVHICSDVAAEQMDYVNANLADQFRLSPYLGTYYLPVKGAADSPLKDPKVRQALSMLIDREFIAEQVWRDTMLPAYSLIPPGIANYVEDVPQLDYADTDILDREDAARALFEEAGVDPASLTIELGFNSSENNRNTMTALADQFSALGIRTTMNEMEGTGYFNYLREDGPFDIVRAGWIGDYNDPQNFLMLYETGVSFNYPRWSNEEFDQLMRDAASETDLDARAQILAQAEQIYLDEVPAIPIMYYSSRALVADSVQGWEDNLMDTHKTRYLSLPE
ncbi:MAG: peptide ABC transporter substrate-binding protein [Paracoccus sp. (in: a-proteobacteria)]|nr:peptide ABC transporter substrate-binding protein [Paracoccus sp. (in: a-proteobacteria)]